MYDSTIYTPAVDRADRDALMDILRSVPIDELAYTARREAYDDLKVELHLWHRDSRKYACA